VNPRPEEALTQKPDPKKRPQVRAGQGHQQPAGKGIPGAEDREAQLKDLTAQCLELMDRLAEAGTERDRLRERCAEIEDELARTQRDTKVSRQRVGWLEEVLSEMHRTSAHIRPPALESLKERSLEAAEVEPPADADGRYERLGRGIDLEHQIKAGLVNLVNTLHGEAAAARSELIELAARTGASEKEQQRIREELEQERSSREAAMNKLREDGATIRELRAVLGAKNGESGEALVQWVRNLQARLNDRDRWVAALLSELASRRLKLTRRGLMDHERKFLEDRNAGGQ
jgi:chromosome segregation ATPase